jgi:hypothetical protein
VSQIVNGESKMKLRIIILLLLTLGILTTAFGQTKENKIKDIRNKFQTINSDTGYSTKTLINEQFLENMPDGGSELTGYFKNGQIKKIFEQIGISYCIRTFEYYFWDERLIFVYEKEEDFPFDEATGSLDFTKTELSFEGRYYFDSGKLFETKVTGQKRIAYDKEMDLEKEFLAKVKQNIDSLKRQTDVH